MWLQRIEMTQPVVFKAELSYRVLAGAQAVMPALVAVASLYATIILLGDVFRPLLRTIVIVAVLCLVLVQPPRELSTQLTSARLTAVVDVIFRWLLLLAVLLAIGYVTKSLQYPRRMFLTWAVLTPVALVARDPGHAGTHAALLDERLRQPQRHHCRLQLSSLELARRLKNNPSDAPRVKGFFDDRSSDRLGMEADAKLIGNLSDVGNYVKEHRTDVIFIALPIRHLKRVMNLAG
jgi:putative colanic acid biosynthesis UDP-glucose lipid carrier transferase